VAAQLAPPDLRAYLADATKTLLAKRRFMDVLPGSVVDSEQVPLIERRLASIAGTRDIAKVLYL
jgi:hypothetical protein